MIHVRTSSRLHFGLLSLNPLSPRRFGGVGLMVNEPGITVKIEQADEWSATGPLSKRALDFVQSFIKVTEIADDITIIPGRIEIEKSAPEHMGLGSGTQLGLAVGRAVAVHLGLDELPLDEITRRVGRGSRSAIGIHGFAQGGLLVDGGKQESDDVAPLVARQPFPDGWRIVMVLPQSLSGLHGEMEEQAFFDLTIPIESTSYLCRLVLMGILPGIVSQDLEVFGEALYDFNREAGRCFKAAQGGIYANPMLSDVITEVRKQGTRGVGQSSWGPTVFAVCGDEEQAAALAEAVRKKFSLSDKEVFVTAAANEGAVTQRI